MNRSAVVTAGVCRSALVLSLLLGSSRGNAGQGGSAEDQQPAAQVALFVLRVTVEGAASTRQYSVWPSVAPLSPQEAGRALAALKKPVRCSGRMDGTILMVGCRPLNQADALEHCDALTHTGQRLRPICASGAPNQSVGLRSCCAAGARPWRCLLKPWKDGCAITTRTSR
jgi:hypothetical protein